MQFIVIDRGDWNDNLVAVVEAETAEKAFSIIRPYVAAPDDTDDDLSRIKIEPLADWLYSPAANNVGRRSP